MQLTTDSIILLCSGLFIAVVAIVTEFASRKKIVQQWLSRKILHTLSVGICGIIPFFLSELTTLFYVVLIAEMLLIVLVSTGILFKEDSGRKSWGIALFPIPYLYFLWVFPMHIWLISLPMLILAISDSVAAISGKLFAIKHFNLTGDQKSWIGSFSFFISTTIILTSAIYFTRIPFVFKDPIYFIFIPLFSLLITLSEAMGSKGTDNLFVPFAASLLLQFFYVAPLEIITPIVLPISILLFLWSSIKFKLLDLSGAIAASLLGATVVLFAGWIWLIPLAFFLLSSTLISKLPFMKKSGRAAKEGRPRDWKQVFCNGGVFGILSTVYCLSTPFYQDDIFVLMLVSMAVATSDTWASEIGVGVGGKVIDLVSFKKVDAGMSGGISFAGTIASVVGAAAIGSLSFMLLPFLHQSLDAFLIVIIAGFSGMLLDSLLGALLQGKYLSNTGDLLDFKSKESQLLKGFDFIDNDLVNLISQLIVLGFAFLFLVST